MGYQRRRRVLRLSFEDHPGLVVEVRTMTVQKAVGLYDLERLQDLSTRKFTGEDMAAIEQIFRLFSKSLLSWTLEDEDGNPIPPTLEAIQDEDLEFMLEIVMAWLQAALGVDNDLGKDSNSGPLFPEGSLPMAPLSPSLVNFPKPS